MTVAALIAAYHESGEQGAGLRATLTLAGRTLLERQARLAASVGANPIIVAVQRVPPALLAAIDRMKGDGLNIIVARNVSEAAEAVHASDRLLLIADGLVANEAHLSRLVASSGHFVLTIADARADDRYERIDATSRWAGLAILDGEMLKRTAAMLQDWDLQSTLLRKALQSGARQVALRGEPVDDQLVVAETGDDLVQLQARIFEGASGLRGGWVSRHLLGFLERAAMRRLMATSATPNSLNLGAALLTILATVAFAWSWLGFGMALLLLATPLEGISERLAALRMQGGEEPSWWTYLLPALAAFALVALGLALTPSRGWGCISLTGFTIAFVLALRVEAHGRAIPAATWLAEHKGLSWLLLPFALAGLWGTALTALALYAGASFFWAQRHVHKGSEPVHQD